MESLNHGERPKESAGMRKGLEGKPWGQLGCSAGEEEAEGGPRWSLHRPERRGTGTDLSGDSDRNRGQGCIYALRYLMMQMNMQDCLQSQTQPPALKKIDLATQPQNITSTISVLNQKGFISNIASDCAAV